MTVTRCRGFPFEVQSQDENERTNGKRHDSSSPSLTHDPTKTSTTPESNRPNARTSRRSHANNNNCTTTKTNNKCATTKTSYNHRMRNPSTKLFRLTFWAMTWPTYNRSSVIIFETATNSLSFAVQDKQQLQNISEYCILWSWNEKSIHQIVSSYLLSDQVANLQSIISDHLRDSDQLTFIRGARQATTAEHLGILYPIIIEWEIYPPKCFVLPFERSSGQHQWSSSRPTANEWNTTNRIQNPSKWSTMDTETVKWMEIVKHMYRIAWRLRVDRPTESASMANISDDPQDQQQTNEIPPIKYKIHRNDPLWILRQWNRWK